ncbi:MAG TPA: phenylalanine--tRNA ligase subunit beta [Actinomycetota bacterium]|nr:phenylalanine--tRNA ligase subunit beta [Actinomycetota bacterium]
MRVPVPWLREFCPTDLRAEELADALTLRGVEVGGVLRPWADLRGVVVARVLDVADHPKADRLSVATVESGSGDRQVVVGVRNYRPGDLVPYAPAGATLPGFSAALERREIRGVTSDGMLCSPKELAISPDHSGILVLPEELGPGEELAALFELDQAVLDVEVFPNRPDLLSVVGVAREVAAATGEELLPPEAKAPEAVERAAGAASVEVVDPDRCPRYLARVIRGVGPGPSPLAAQVRLTAGGMRPLSSVVDATNYALLELGHPLHPFDLNLLAGPGIVVRRAAGGERLRTLDGIDRVLEEDDLVIADLERAVAVAGVMGGGDSEVGPGTVDVLLESAYFQPLGVLRTARRLGVRTEASVRFERGADPEAVGPAATRAAALILEWAGGTLLAGEIDVGRAPPRRSLSVRPERASALIGTDLGSAEVREALGRLRLRATDRDGEVIVEVPGYRADLEREVDLIEEVARVAGYDRVPSTLPGVRQAGGLTHDQRLRRRVRDVLAGAGLVEASSSSFVAASDLRLFEDVRRHGVRIANPVSEEEAYLRTSLLPGLVRAARRNVANRRTSVRLFEVGRTFTAEGADPDEAERLAVLLTGPAAEEWPGERRPLDFLDAKGVLEHLLRALGVRRWGLSQIAFAPFHPGRCAEIVLEGQPPVGELAELHPGVAETFDLPDRVAVFEVRLDRLLAEAADDVVYRDVSRFPPLRRDLAYEVGRDVPAGAVRAALVDEAGPLLDRVLLFDVFEGPPVPEGRKSLALHVDFRAPDRTLTDEEADERVRAITERLGREFDAQLRA